MRFQRHLGAVLAAGLVASALSATAASADPRGTARNTDADYTPFEEFQPTAASSACVGATNEPFALPADYDQQVLAQEGDGGSTDLWDMNTQNESGRDSGRYVYRTHEVGAGAAGVGGSQVTVTDLTTGETEVLAQRTDWERFDGIVWTRWGTILAAEETTNDSADDPDFPAAEAGLVYELFLDPSDLTQLNQDDPRDDVGAADGIAVRPALGSKSHEGMRFDRNGYHYGISESNPGGIFRFVPDKKGDLSEGTLSVLKTTNGHDGSGEWLPIPDEQAEFNAQIAATSTGANGYSRPEDVETGESTGVDRNNGGQTLYVAMTGTDEVLAVDLSSPRSPFAYDYVHNTGHSAANPSPNATSEFDAPDNLALDAEGNLAISEDPGGDPPAKTKGDDIWIAVPPENAQGKHHGQASTVQRFASLKDCSAEPTGIYFALEGTEEFTEDTRWEDLVTDESLFVNRQHAAQGTTLDQFVSIAPADD